ncbi:MAG: formylglycine-generating enzyme family protein [Spirochaetia bacterium]|nr:formylglycine-generating enzyme family protein [Spirochaetia bacterium]
MIPAGIFVPFFKDTAPVRVHTFYLDQMAVTNREFLAFVNARPEWRRDRAKRIFADAAYLTHWHSALEFADSIAEQPVTNVSFFASRAYCAWVGKRLPGLAEWEYALEQNRNGTLNLLDMPGKNWEWVADFNSVMLPAESRTGADKDLFCGGSVANGKDARDYATYMRYAFRSSLRANYNTANLGFRCARDQ